MAQTAAGSGAVEEVSVIGIESKADRISVPVILKSLHVQSNSVPGRGCTVQESQITQVLDNLNQERAGAAPGSQTWMCSGRKPSVNSAPGAKFADLVFSRLNRPGRKIRTRDHNWCFRSVYSARTLRKFILGAPINPATNRFAGR